MYTYISIRDLRNEIELQTARPEHTIHSTCPTELTRRGGMILCGAGQLFGIRLRSSFARTLPSPSPQNIFVFLWSFGVNVIVEL